MPRKIGVPGYLPHIFVDIFVGLWYNCLVQNGDGDVLSCAVIPQRVRRTVQGERIIPTAYHSRVPPKRFSQKACRTAALKPQ